MSDEFKAANTGDAFMDAVYEAEAQRRWKTGENPSFSTGICEMVTAGYGAIDQYGYFQYPLYPGHAYLSMLKTGKNPNNKPPSELKWQSVDTRGETLVVKNIVIKNDGL